MKPKARWSRLILLVLGALSIVVALYARHLATPQIDYLRERHGKLTDRSVESAATGAAINEYVSLQSSSGLAVDLRVLRPDETGPLPVLILLGGHRTGRDAVDLVGEPDGTAFVALDYPYTGNNDPDGFWESLAIVNDVKRGLMDATPALSLTLDWLLEQPWIDSERVILVGVSLGVPFAAAAAALDDRFSQVFLLHGGGDNVSWVSHAGRKAIENETLRRFAAGSLLFFMHGNTFDTPQWIRKTAPRPVVLVMAENDDYVPKEAQLPLIDVARLDHVELVWTEGVHIRPSREFELRQLLDTVLSRVATD